MIFLKRLEYGMNILLSLLPYYMHRVCVCVCVSVVRVEIIAPGVLGTVDGINIFYYYIL